MNEDNSTKASFNWYPGHMAKTKKQIIEDLKLIDIVVELLDARIPNSSRNPVMNEIIKDKKKIVVLNKSDLSDTTENQKWLNYYKLNKVVAVCTDSNSGKGIQNMIKEIESMMQEEIDEYAQKGRVGRKIRVMVLGIPNVGKSSFINKIAKRNTAEVANRPGVTRKKQWIRLNDKIELLDTPGVLWPKFESEEVALNLAYTGTIKDDIIDITEVAFQLLKYLLDNCKEKVIERYKLDECEIDKILNNPQDENLNKYEIMQMIGKKRGALVSGGMVDDEKTAKIIIEDFRKCRIGKITLEKVK